MPQIRPIFSLIKQDDTDFDRDAVTKWLDVRSPYIRTAPPRFSPGLLHCDGHDRAQSEFESVTILPADVPPYRMMIHATWELYPPKLECRAVEEALQCIEPLLRGKATVIVRICEEYNLCASLCFNVFAESQSLPVLELPRESVKFWASMGVKIAFDMYLD